MNSLYVVHLELAIIFISLVLRPLLKLSIYCIDEPWGITGQIVESMHVLRKGLGPFVSHMNSAAFMRISPEEK